MSLVIHQKFHRIKESIDFALWVCSDLKHPSIKNETPQLIQVKEIHQKITNELHFNDEEKRFFIKYPSGFNVCLAQLLIFSFLPINEIETSTAKETLLSKFKEIDLNQFPEFSLSPFGFEFQDKHQPLIESIKQLEISESQKLELIYCFYNYPKAIDELFTILEKIETVINPYLTQLETQQYFPMLNESLPLCEKLLAKYGVKNQLEAMDNVQLYPSLCWYMMLSITSLNQFPNFYMFFSGYAFSLEDFLNRTYDINEEHVRDFLKLISDPSKLEILKHIKQTPRYGQELANLLNLKTSTISYHMEALLNAHLVSIERKNNRYYYSLEKEEIATLLNYLHDLLC